VWISWCERRELNPHGRRDFFLCVCVRARAHHETGDIGIWAFPWDVEAKKGTCKYAEKRASVGGELFA
jgi:hypothetical protein